MGSRVAEVADLRHHPDDIDAGTKADAGLYASARDAAGLWRSRKRIAETKANGDVGQALLFAPGVSTCFGLTPSTISLF